MRIFKFIENEISKTRSKLELFYTFIIFILFYNLFVKFFQIILFVLYKIQNVAQGPVTDSIPLTISSSDFYYTIYTLIFYSILQEVLFRLPLVLQEVKEAAIINKLFIICGLSSISALMFYILNPLDGFFSIFVDSIVFGFFASALFLILNSRLGVWYSLVLVILFNFLLSFNSYLLSIFI
jgi:hypothetical protein